MTFRSDLRHLKALETASKDVDKLMVPSDLIQRFASVIREHRDMMGQMLEANANLNSILDERTARLVAAEDLLDNLALASGELLNLSIKSADPEDWTDDDDTMLTEQWTGSIDEALRFLGRGSIEYKDSEEN